MPVNTAALKTFAPAMRRQLLEAVGRKLDLLLLSQTPDTLSTYTRQIAELREQEAENREQLLERVAYTWFNRLCALRYLDARGWHPFGCKVLMPAAEGETQPELLRLMRAGNLPAALKGHTSESRLHGLLDGKFQTAHAGADPQGEVYRELVLATCRCYHELLPNLFEGLDDASELLLPDDLLSDGSIAGGFRRQISDDDCQDVESLGWLYQFYIAEKKDEVMVRKKAVPTEDIPAVTQLFTPHWIVRYLVENSLGRLWLLNRPSSRLKAQMPYYIEGEAETDFLKINKPEEIKLLDPACGSGHMLTYAFDLLTLIYEEEGYAPTEIPALIMRHNLHGLEICPRAAQLAQLALVFKARGKSRRFFQPEHLVRPRIIELRDVRFAENELRDYIHALGLGDLFNQPMIRLLHQFEEAKNFGSLIQPCLDERAIANARRAMAAAENRAKDLGGQLFLSETHLKVLRVLEQAEALTQRYHVVVANPPYMGSGGMNVETKEFALAEYPDVKSNLFSMFIARILRTVKPGGEIGVMTPISWMSLASYRELRSTILNESTITTFVQPEYNAFWDSAHVAICAFTLHAKHIENYKGVYINLAGCFGSEKQSAKTLEAIRDSACKFRFRASGSDFAQIPGSPIAYWIKGISNFKGRRIGDIFFSGGRNKTHNNEEYLRYSWEISATGARWANYANGGNFRKYAGNNLEVVDWSPEARAFYESNGGLLNEKFWGKEGITWSLITSAICGFRLKSSDQFYSSGSPTIFNREFECDYTALGYLNSPVASYFLRGITPTVNTTVNDVFALPFPNCPFPQRLVGDVRTCISIARTDWDNFETSWDFRDQPLLRPGLKGATLEASWRNWEAQSTAAIRRMQELETENNRLFIAAYGLDGELQPEVPEAQITLARAEARRDMAAFLSYAVGCMMGRYSPDHPGLILANAGDTLREFLEKVGKPLANLTFAPDEDGILPVLDGEWFEDDIVARSREFLAVTFPESSVAENLRFIEESLGKDIRKYFCSEFYKDHLQTYKKRPIYWMVQSPRKGFACLIYLHRYTKDTLNQVLNIYFRPYLQKLEARLAQLGLDQLNDSLPTRDRTAARKEAEKITKVLKECQAWEQDALLPLAQQRIELDLDHGVKVNYLKLQDVLAPIPGLAAKEE